MDVLTKIVGFLEQPPYQHNMGGSNFKDEENMNIISIYSNACISERIKNIPQELINTPFWCCYRLEPNPSGSKPHKIPYNPISGQRGKVNVTGTLCGFGEAFEGVESGQYDGINYAFGYDEFIGLDLDGVLNPETGELEESAAEVLRLFKSTGAYVEVSPSGKGLRIICKGTLPRFGKGVDGFSHLEIYGRGEGGLHFLSITGNVIASVDNLVDCQVTLDWFYEQFIKRPEKPPTTTPKTTLTPSPEMEDDDIVDLLRRSKFRSDFYLLYNDGNLSGDHSTDDLRLCSMLGFYTQNSEQIDRILRQSALMRPKWERTDYRNNTIQKALDGLTATYQPPQTRQHTTYGLSELEAARRFLDSETVETFRVLRQARSPKTMRFNGAIWVEDFHSHELQKAVGNMSKTILVEMQDESNTGRRDALYGLAKKLETRRGLQDITAFVVARLPEFIPSRSNTATSILCVKNGLLHLGAGVVTPHDADFQYTIQSPVTFDKEATCPLWLKFLVDFACNDTKLIYFLQVWFGYCLSGETTEHKMAVFFGGGCNGKSVLLNTVGFVLGGFAGVTPADTLLQRRSEQSNDLAALEGLRFVVAAESDEGQALAEGRVKAITGGDRVVCRRLFEEFGSYTPQFKLNLATNSKPRVSGTDNGIWRRLLLIPCNAHVTNPDKSLEIKLRLEASGILSWMLEGYRIWIKEGLTLPDCIKQATQDYRQEADTIGRFIDEVCNPYRDGVKSDGLKASKVYAAYQAWCIQEGFKPLASTRFGQKMAEKGYKSVKQKTGQYYPWELTQPR